MRGRQRIVSARNLKETHTPQIVLRMEQLDRDMFPNTNQMSYGMAWVIQDHRGHLLLQHAGAIDGFRCHFTLVPEARLGIVLLCNLHHARMNIALSNNLLDVLLGMPRRNWNAVVAEAQRKHAARLERLERERLDHRHRGTHPSRELAAYAGAYEHPAYGMARVTLEEGVLVWNWNNFRAPLTHFHFDTFTLPFEVMGQPEVVFALDAAGTVTRMKVLGNVDIEFHRARTVRPAR